MTTPAEAVLYRTRGRVAIITLNHPKKLNALTHDAFFRLSSLLRSIAADPAISVTVITGKGRFFSAGVDVQTATSNLDRKGDKLKERQALLERFSRHNLYLTHSFYSHPKILVAALNGPAVGMMAAVLGFCDFIYATPHTYLLTPFSSLGLVTEGGASIGLVQRLGIAKANEALIMSRRLPCDELVQCGFINRVIESGSPGDDVAFLSKVLEHVEANLGDHLDQDSVLGIKKLIREPLMEKLDAQTIREVLGGVDRFESGAPQMQFERIASRQKNQKL